MTVKRCSRIYGILSQWDYQIIRVNTRGSDLENSRVSKMCTSIELSIE